MDTTCVILFPDPKGAAAQGAFGNALLDRYASDRATLLAPLITGITHEQVLKTRLTTMGFCPRFITQAQGSAQILLQGYAWATDHFPEATIVCIDSDGEHPIGTIPLLVQTSQRTGGMVIGDLRFGPGQIVPNSLDECLLRLCPLVHSTLTHGRLVLSGVHGFQAFAPGACVRIFAVARNIMTGASNARGRPLRWGFPGAMALGAVVTNHEITTIPIDATVARNRPKTKVIEQLGDFICVLLAARQLYEF